jgi:hypothetical protein
LRYTITFSTSIATNAISSAQLFCSQIRMNSTAKDAYTS